jgi:predicted dehydrogenase
MSFRGAIIGYGFIASRGHLPAYLARKDVEIVAVADVCAARRVSAGSALPSARIYDSAEELLGAEAARLDFVDLATPPVDHAPLAEVALSRGLHVLCEKPLATSAAAGRRMLEAAKRAERVLFPCHNYKRAPVVRAIRSLLDSGRIGAVRGVSLSTYRPTHARGVAEWRPDWRRDPAVGGGGIGMDHGSHTFYLAFDWMSAYPTRISAKIATLDRRHPLTEDNLSAVLTFPSGLVHAQLSWTSGARKVIYALQGESGTIIADDDRLELMLKTPDGFSVERRVVPSSWMDASHTSWFQDLFDAFLGAVAARDFAGSEAEDALCSLEVIEAAYRSAADGCREQPIFGLGLEARTSGPG